VLFMTGPFSGARSDVVDDARCFAFEGNRLARAWFHV
jgi:hypothetical protein